MYGPSAAGSPGQAVMPSGDGAGDSATIPASLQSDAAVMLEGLVDRLFLRALQFLLGGVLFGVAFFPVRGRHSVVEILTAAVLLTLAVSALRWRRPLVQFLRRYPPTTMLFPVPALLAVTLDGGFDSVWTPLVAITVGVPATLGMPGLSFCCAVGTAIGQAAAAWINRAETRGDTLVETALFNALGTISVGIGISISVATLGVFLQRRPQVVARMREQTPMLGPHTDRGGDGAQPRRLPPAPRVKLSGAEHAVVARLAAGRVPKQVALDLGVALSTVRTHLRNAKRKTHARTLTELVGIFVMEDGQL